MTRYRVLATLNSILAVTLLSTWFTTNSSADPLTGRDLLKFSQKPMNLTPIQDINGTVTTYGGHDELSTAYGFGNAAGPPQLYQGRFMADDFADNLSSPVVHVKWWGSYLGDFIDPGTPVNNFLIAFEADVPATGPPPTFSTPGAVLQTDVVSRSNSLSPGSGQFTEKLIRGPVNGESLYEYNAELHLSQNFFENKDTVYWLKISALVDVPATYGTFNPFNPQSSLVPVTQWGWHNRDYTIQNTLASPNIVGPPFPPGEAVVGNVGANTPVWHFQDDSVAGDLRVQYLNGFPVPTFIQQSNMLPQQYIDGLDGPGSSVPGAVGIGQFSKDLAFELYTLVPEPTSCLMLGVGLATVFMQRRRSRDA